MLRVVVFVLSVLALITWMVVRGVCCITFDRDCGGHLKRAADANTIELATKELDTVISYLKEHNMTTGYTSVIYSTPDEDIGFWYDNLSASLEELKKMDPKATQLERTNVLMKLRETLLDEGKGTSVTSPDGISIYPANTFWALFATFVTVIGIISLIAVIWKYGE